MLLRLKETNSPECQRKDNLCGWKGCLLLLPVGEKAMALCKGVGNGKVLSIFLFLFSLGGSLTIKTVFSFFVLKC